MKRFLVLKSGLEIVAKVVFPGTFFLGARNLIIVCRLNPAIRQLLPQSLDTMYPLALWSVIE